MIVVHNKRHDPVYPMEQRERKRRPMPNPERIYPGCGLTKELIVWVQSGSHRLLRKLRAQYWLSDPHCYYCRTYLKLEETTYDHILPVSRGGKTTFDNGRLACSFCNCHRDRDMDWEYHPSMRSRKTPAAVAWNIKYWQTCADDGMPMPSEARST